MKGRSAAHLAQRDRVYGNVLVASIALLKRPSRSRYRLDTDDLTGRTNQLQELIEMQAIRRADVKDGPARLEKTMIDV